jgi:uncharacterized protein (TIGR02001 family)
MSKSRIAAAAALLAVAGAANAEMTVDAALVSDYDWRGISQSGNDGAFQLGGTYSFDSGLYLGLWGSTLGNASQSEIDVTAGFAGEFSNSGVGYDLGATYYTYTDDSDANFVELYAGLSYGVFSGKFSYSPNFAGDYGDDNGFYVEADAKVPLGNGFSFLAHAGYSFGDGVKAAYAGDNYFDWSAGIGYDVGDFSTFVKYVDGSDVASGASNESRFLFGISTTLPWGK